MRIVLMIAAATVIAGSFVIAGLALAGWFSDTDQLRKENAQAWHEVLCLAQKQMAVNPLTTAADRQEAQKFYAEALVLVNAEPCPAPAK